MQTRPILSTAILALLFVPALRADIGMQFVNVGNAGNTADTTVMWDGTSGYGSVGYTYEIGKFDVTLSQYTAFLNAVAQTDSYGLYNPALATNLNVAGIARAGGLGTFSYSVIGSGNRPVTYVSWFDAARFSNWMNNGRPTGLGEVAASTEQGAYTLNGATSGIILKNAGAQAWIPSEDEFYKAAWYDPTLNSGTGGYWLYPTRSNVQPHNPNGSTTDPNSANYYSGGYAVTGSSFHSNTQNYLTDVGAYTLASSYYGTFDQGGLVNQWNDGVDGSLRELRDCNWHPSSGELNMQSKGRGGIDPAYEAETIGFRIATVPEPSVAGIFIFAGGLLLARRRRAF